MTASEGAELPRLPGIELAEASVPSSIDGRNQPIIIGVPDSYEPGTPTPLLVGLHTWSYGYSQRAEAYGRQAAERGWLLVLPHFRGPNTTANPRPREAGGSLLAQHDIVDAYRHMVESFNVDLDRVYLTGDSGGGHMTLLMAGKYPDLWAAAAAYCPPTDLREWWEVHNSYAQHIEAVCGGPPGAGPEIDFEYLRRSPRTFMTNLAPLDVLLAHGDRDPTIPVEQSWRTFRVLEAVPEHRTVLHAFSGGHESDHDEALDWLAEHRRPALPPRQLHLVTDESKAYYWAELGVADESRLASAELVCGGSALSIATANLDALSLDLLDFELPAGGIYVSVRNDRPLSLTIDSAPVGAAVEPEAAWAERAPRTDAIALTIAPSDEARSLRIRY
ncbi:MAG: alpha/beta hydrolase family protein [Armatimonadota bacterium]